MKKRWVYVVLSVIMAVSALAFSACGSTDESAQLQAKLAKLQNDAVKHSELIGELEKNNRDLLSQIADLQARLDALNEKIEKDYRFTEMTAESQEVVAEWNRMPKGVVIDSEEDIALLADSHPKTAAWLKTQKVDFKKQSCLLLGLTYHSTATNLRMTNAHRKGDTVTFEFSITYPQYNFVEFTDTGFFFKIDKLDGALDYRIEVTNTEDYEYNGVLHTHEGYFIRGWKNEVKGAFYSLFEAYDNGWLTLEDIKSIAYYHHGGVGSNEEIMGEDFAPKEKIPAELSLEKQLELRWSEAYGVSSLDERHYYELNDFRLLKYYGTYGDCIAVLTTNVDWSYALPITTHTIGGVEITYGDTNFIKVYKPF